MFDARPGHWWDGFTYGSVRHPGQGRWRIVPLGAFATSSPGTDDNLNANRPILRLPLSSTASRSFEHFADIDIGKPSKTSVEFSAKHLVENCTNSVSQQMREAIDRGQLAQPLFLCAACVLQSSYVSMATLLLGISPKSPHLVRQRVLISGGTPAELFKQNIEFGRDLSSFPNPTSRGRPARSSPWPRTSFPSLGKSARDPVSAYSAISRRPRL